MRHEELSVGKLVYDKMVANYGNLGGGASAALVMGHGTSALPVTTSVADKNFMDFRTKSSAATGDSRGLYMRHYLAGTVTTTAYGDCIRAMTLVTGTGYAYASGIHATLQINASATISGSGAAGRFTLAAAADTRTMSGNTAALQIDSDIAAGNTVPATAALIRLTKSGAVDVGTFLHIADDQCLKGSSATGAVSDALKVIMVDGTTVRYINLYAAS